MYRRRVPHGSATRRWIPRRAFLRRAARPDAEGYVAGSKRFPRGGPRASSRLAYATSRGGREHASGTRRVRRGDGLLGRVRRVHRRGPRGRASLLGAGVARAMWKGVVRVGGRRVPVRLYAAVADRTVHFRLLHKKDRTPVRQRMVNSRTGKEIPREEIRKGYEIERGVFVMLAPEDLERAEPEDTRDIIVDRFVDAGAVGPEWYERPYWLAPDGKGAGDYAALAAALG